MALTTCRKKSTMQTRRVKDAILLGNGCLACTVITDGTGEFPHGKHIVTTKVIDIKLNGLLAKTQNTLYTCVGGIHMVLQRDNGD